jgi:hypothetical protein
MGADASQFIGRQVTLQNDHHKYLSTNGTTFTGSPNQAAWEQWTLEAAVTSSDRKVTHVYLHNAAHDVRLSASDNKKNLTASKNRAAWEQWQLESAGDRFYLRSHHGTYLNQGSDGNTLQSNNKGGSELFRIAVVGGGPATTTHSPAAHAAAHVHVHHHHHAAPAPAPAAPAPAPAASGGPTGRFYLTNGHGKQLGAKPDGTFKFTTNKADWERFTITSEGSKVVISTHHGSNLQMDGEKFGVSKNRGGWEQWTLTPAGGGKYYIVAHTGKHLGAKGDDSIYCSNSNTGGWEQWTLSPA